MQLTFKPTKNWKITTFYEFYKPIFLKFVKISDFPEFFKIR